jgi:NADH:ubiquinone oxidoreductase subunit 3 (subunit A)
MPPGEVRSRLESFCARSKLRCRDILVWKTGGARIFNAGVMGVVGRWRYILFTDALLANMSPVELEAVLAHELGHVRHRHVPKYVLFLLLFMMAGGVLVQLLPLSWTNNIWSMIGIMIVMGILILYTLFGFISRRFEHQADLESARLLGSPVPLVMALERLSILAGNPRTHYDWRHDSVAMRVRAVLRRGFDESIIARYGRRMRRLTAVLLVGGILLTTGGAWAAEQVLQHRHSRRVKTYEAGRQAEEAGRINEAISKYQQLAQAGYVVGDLQLARLHADADRPGVYDPERAMQHARKAMSVNEREDRWQIELHWTMAMVYLAQGDLVLAQQRKALAEQAIAEFDDAEPGQKEELLSDLEEDFREQREHVLGLPETPAAE